jgi:hypothetical protein
MNSPVLSDEKEISRAIRGPLEWRLGKRTAGAMKRLT